MVILQMNAEQPLTQPFMGIKTESGANHTDSDLAHSSSDKVSVTRIFQASAKLLNHVARINSQIKENKSEETYGALLDLFIILESDGRMLRERMLNKARSVINPQQFDFLQQQLKQGITELEIVPQSHTSTLIDEFLTSDDLSQNIESGYELNVLQAARDLLEHGQIDSARSVLESAVLNGELKLEVHEDLLEIYRETNDTDNFSRVWKQLHLNNRSLSHLWEGFIKQPMQQLHS